MDLRSRPSAIAIVSAYVALFWVVLPASLWWAALRIDAAMGWNAAPHPVGWTLVLAGIGLLGWGTQALWTVGGGLPVSALPPPRFVARGPYRLVRHPIYLGFEVAVIGVGLVAGSAALAGVIGPALLPAWMLYAAVEERGLARRFGADYAAYRMRVGWLPRVPILSMLRLTQFVFRPLALRVEGRDRFPATGPVVVVANHRCYFDPAFVTAAVGRRVHFVTTAEAFRHPVAAWLLRNLGAFPVRRYAVDLESLRQIQRLLAAGEVVGVFPEGERSPLGTLQPLLPAAVRFLARLDVPIVPVGLSGNYDAGPRWSDTVRRRPVVARIGEALRLGPSPAEEMSAALGALIDDPLPSVDLVGLERRKLARVLWACPECRADGAWDIESLRCGDCGWQATVASGRFRRPDGTLVSLAELAAPLWATPPATALRTYAHLSRERETADPRPRPLEPLTRGAVALGNGVLRCDRYEVAVSDVLKVTIERADTVQVGTKHGMWAFHLPDDSAFRVARVLSAVVGGAPVPGAMPVTDLPLDRAPGARRELDTPRPWQRGLWVSARTDYRQRALPSRFIARSIELCGRPRRIAIADGEGTPVVVLPGLYGAVDEGLFADVAAQAARAGARVAILEDQLATDTLRLNRGRTASLRELGAELDALIRSLGGPVDLLAFSAGLAVALAADPRAVRRIIGWSGVIELKQAFECVTGSAIARTYFDRVHRRAWSSAGLPVPDARELLMRSSHWGPFVRAHSAVTLLHAADDPVAPIGPVRLRAATRGWRFHELCAGGHLGFGVLWGTGVYLEPLRDA